MAEEWLLLVSAVTSEDVCWSIRNVKFLIESFYNMRCVVMFITAVCLIFFLKFLPCLGAKQWQVYMACGNAWRNRSSNRQRGLYVVAE